MLRIAGIDVHDVRFPTSIGHHGSDAMHVDPDYSAAYVVLRTGTPLEGHGFAFTIGRGNEVVCAAIRALEPYRIGLDAEAVTADLGAFGKRLTHDSQLRLARPGEGRDAARVAHGPPLPGWSGLAPHRQPNPPMNDAR